jgi:quercetin dioxygenase-like cupin family protein
VVPRRSPEDSPPLGEEIVQALAEGVAPAELSAQQRDSMRARVLEGATDAPPQDTETIRGAEVGWRQAWPGVWIKVLKRDPEADFQVTLMRFEPGGVIPAHPHRRNEECYVLEGEVHVGTHRVVAGDFHIAHAGGRHPDLMSRLGALVIVRSELY